MTDPDRRFVPRDDQPFWANVMHWLAERSALRKTLGLVLGSSMLGGLIIWAVMRLLVLDQVQAQDADHSGRMARIEAEAAVTRALVDSNTSRLLRLNGAAGTILNAVCADFTKAQQRQRNMTCDAEIYRGAPGLEP